MKNIIVIALTCFLFGAGCTKLSGSDASVQTDALQTADAGCAMDAR